MGSLGYIGLLYGFYMVIWAVFNIIVPGIDLNAAVVA